MDNLCGQMWPCYVLPIGWHWIMAILMPLLVLVIIGVPVANILHRSGRSRWWTIFAFIPFVNLIGLWVFACLGGAHEPREMRTMWHGFVG